MTVYEQRPLYAAITTQLSSTGRPVGQGVRPKGDMPYAVLYPWPDILNEGSLSDGGQISVARFQVTCVGGTMEEAQWLQHKVRGALVDWKPSLSGVSNTRVELDAGAGISRDDDRTPPVFFTTDRFRVWFTGLEEESSSS